jgi:hypothetical protein
MLDTEVQLGDPTAIKQTIEINSLPFFSFDSNFTDDFWRDYSWFVWEKLTTGLIVTP